LSATPQEILSATYGVEVIHDCLVVVTSFHHAGHHLYQQVNGISACRLHAPLADAWEIVRDVILAEKQSSHLGVLEQENTTLTEDGHDSGESRSVNGNEISHNENDAFDAHQNTP